MVPCALQVGWRVLQKLLDEVDVGHNHAAAAVPIESKAIHSLTTDG